MAHLSSGVQRRSIHWQLAQQPNYAFTATHSATCHTLTTPTTTTTTHTHTHTHTHSHMPISRACGSDQLFRHSHGNFIKNDLRQFTAQVISHTPRCPLSPCLHPCCTRHIHRQRAHKLKCFASLGQALIDVMRHCIIHVQLLFPVIAHPNFVCVLSMFD